MKTYRIITTLLSAAVFVSCNYLDFDETNGLNTHDNIYKYFDNTKQMLTNVYSYIPQDFGAVEEAMRDCASDDAEFGNTGGGVQDFNNGNWSALRTHDTAWSLYNGIRAANEFIASIADVDFSRFEYGPSYPNWERQLRYFPYEARMLRAFYFFELARRYGDIAMPTRVLTIEEANTIGKMSFDEVIGFIVADADACAADGHCPIRMSASQVTRRDVSPGASHSHSNPRHCSMRRASCTILRWMSSVGNVRRRQRWI